MTFFLANEFSCLSNAVVQAGLSLRLDAVFMVAEKTRLIARVKNVPARDVWQVRLHQCPREGHVLYRVEVLAKDGRRWDTEFLAASDDRDHDTYVLYDRDRDGVVQYLHVVH